MSVTFPAKLPTVNLNIDNTRVNEPKDYSPADDSVSCAPLTIPAGLGGLRLDQALARLFPEHSRSRLQAWLKEGRIRLDGGKVDANGDHDQRSLSRSHQRLERRPLTPRRIWRGVAR